VSFFEVRRRLTSVSFFWYDRSASFAAWTGQLDTETGFAHLCSIFCQLLVLFLLRFERLLVFLTHALDVSDTGRAHSHRARDPSSASSRGRTG
jgi:hypothetical protein